MKTAKNYARCETLPLGAIRAGGFLKEQLERSKAGMGGHLPEIEPGMIAHPYIHKTYVKQWGDGDQSGWGAEISGNYYAGFVQLAFTLNDEDLKQQAEEWVNGVLKNQREDGYLGTYYEPDARIYEDYNAWGTACGMRALLFYYQATGREDVFDAVYRCMLWFTDHWAGDKKTSYAGGFIIEPMLLCYQKTGDKRLLQFAEDYTEYLADHTVFGNSYRHYLDKKLHYYSNHTAAYGSLVRMPALLYSANGKKLYLRASENGVKKMLAHGVQLSGAPVSASEYVGPIGAIQEAEYCNFAFFNSSYISLAAVTGESRYGDYMENMVYNAAEGARKKDERAIAYLSSPNQVFATTGSSNYMGDMQVYSPCYPVSCCPVNSVAVIPEFVRGMAMTGKAGNLYIHAYGPCEIAYDGWKITEDTLYPFRNELTFHVASWGKGHLFLKIPSWARDYTLKIDGKETDILKNEQGFVEVPEAELIDLSFTCEPEVIQVDDRDCANKRPLAFRYGALLFSLKIEASWDKFYPKTETPLTEEWPWFNVNPVMPEVYCPEPHEFLGVRRDHFPWSVAVDERLAASDVQVEFCPPEGYPWENAYIKLHIPAYKAPLTNAPYARRTYDIFGERAEVTDPVELTLVPYGATNLRITYFPRAELKK